jgi:hypothetical protein
MHVTDGRGALSTPVSIPRLVHVHRCNARFAREAARQSTSSGRRPAQSNRTVSHHVRVSGGETAQTGANCAMQRKLLACKPGGGMCVCRWDVGRREGPQDCSAGPGSYIALYYSWEGTSSVCTAAPPGQAGERRAPGSRRTYAGANDDFPMNELLARDAPSAMRLVERLPPLIVLPPSGLGRRSKFR